MKKYKNISEKLMKSFKNNKAIALILAIFMLIAFSMLGLTALNLVSLRATTTVSHLNSIKALYLAEAGLNFFKEYTLPWDNAFNDTDAFMPSGGLVKILGASTNEFFTIAYTASTARTATVRIRGTAQNNTTLEVERTITIALTEDDNAYPVRRSFRNYSLYFDNPSGYSIGPNSPGPSLHCNAYFNNSISGHYYGQVGQPTTIRRNIYVNGNYNVPSPYIAQIWGDAYANGSITDKAQIGIQGKAYYKAGTSCSCTTLCPCCTAPSSCGSTCPSSPPAGCESSAWGPTCGCVVFDFNSLVLPQKPAIDPTYYSKLYQRTNSSPATTITSINSTFELKGMNLYVRNSLSLGDFAVIKGPGNIVINGELTVYSGAVIDERVGIIARNIKIGHGAMIGGDTLDTSGNFITDKGAVIYVVGSNSVSYDISYSSSASTSPTRVKASILMPAGYDNNNVAQFEMLGKVAQIQGIAYTNKTVDNHIGSIYGYIYTIPTTTQLRAGTVKDLLSISGTEKTTFSELPVEVKGLYRLTETSRTYD